MDEFVQSCREEAKQYRGVWYDSRAKKFAAEIYSRGERFFLGHFATAAEASEAYTVARDELPRGKAEQTDRFRDAFEEFLEIVGRDTKGNPVQGEPLVYRDQVFEFDGVAFKKMNGRRRPFYSWRSTCLTCDAPYETLTATSPAAVKGIARNCPEHRSRRPLVVENPGRDETVPVAAWADVVRSVFEAMSFVSDDIKTTALIDQCHTRHPGLPRRFNWFLLRDERSPVMVVDGMCYARRA